MTEFLRHQLEVYFIENPDEAQKIAEKARISAEILDLTNEMNSLKGLFVGMKRKKLQARINELNDQLRRLK